MPQSLNQKTGDLSQHLYSFRISDRLEIERTLRSPAGNRAAFLAVTDYVERWENSDWLEAYSIERIGKWFGKQAEISLVEDLERWSLDQDTSARRALLDGLKKGRVARIAGH